MPAKTQLSGSAALQAAARRLGARLRALREAREMTLESAAEASDLNPVHVWKVEKAQLNVTLGTLVKLATAYGLTLEDLFSATPARRRK